MHLDEAAQPDPQKDLSSRLAFRPNEVPAVLGISRSAVFDMMKRGEIESVKIGGKRLITRRAIERLLSGQSCEQEAA